MKEDKEKAQPFSLVGVLYFWLLMMVFLFSLTLVPVNVSGDSTDNPSKTNRLPFSTSFEKSDKTTLKNQLNQKLKSKNISNFKINASNRNMMSSTVSNGPQSAINQKSKMGWSGKKAEEFSGKVENNGNSFSNNNLVDNLNLKVTPNTNLQYKIFPTNGKNDYDYNYDYSFTPMYVAVNLEFSDGTYLSQLKPISTDNFTVTPQGQGSSRSLYYNQWNQITTNIGKVASGKTIKKVMISFQNPKGQKGKTFDDFLDDIKIENKANPSVNRLNKLDYVNTLRGANSSGDFSRGLNVPAATVPNGFNFWSPATNYKDNNLYTYQNNGGNKFQYMTVSHEPSIWVGDRGTWQFMVNSSINPNKVTKSQDISHTKYNSQFSHQDEIAKPQLYSVKFPKKSNAAGTKMSLTPSMHGAIANFQFDKTAKNKNVIFDSAQGNGSLSFDKNHQTFRAVTKNGNNGMHQMYVYGKFSSPFESSKVENKKQGIVSFKSPQVSMKVATSFLSAGQAKKNYQLELAAKNFSQLKQNTSQKWNHILDKISVQGASYNQLVTLYSNMYRLYMYPNLYAENVGTNLKPNWQHSDPYQGSMENPVARPGQMYANNGFWDTYRTAWPAYSILSPRKEGQYLNGLVQHYKDQGWVPRWIAPGGTNSMVGTNSDIIFADALMKGIPFNTKDAYQSAIKNATVQSSNLVNGGRKDLNQSEFLGYVPYPYKDDNYGMSWSMEGYINDWGLYQMAQKKGQKAQAEYFKNRALGYVKLFDKVGTKVGDKWFKGKKEDGSWSTSKKNFDPTSWAKDYTETDAYDMAATVPQDGRGLANLYGGSKGLTQKLDSIINTPGNFAKTDNVIHEMREQREVKLGQYGHSNQPSHDILYMYAFSSQPWKTQKYVRDVLSRLYVGSDFGQGYLGDEDNGEQSAWYILSSLGIYPQNLASNQFVLGSPLFKQARVSLPNGRTLTVKAPNNSDKNIYVNSVTLNGRKIPNLYLNYKDIMAGGTLQFNMSPTPNKSRGLQNNQKPTSLTQNNKPALPKVDIFDKTKNVTSNISNNERLTDNNSSTFTQIKNGNSIQVKLDKPHQINMLTLSNISKDTSFKAAKIYASNDGKKWDQISQLKNINFTYNKSTKPYLISNNQNNKAYTKYKIQFKGTGKLGEIELLGN